jgi:hypothetical protein
MQESCQHAKCNERSECEHKCASRYNMFACFLRMVAYAFEGVYTWCVRLGCSVHVTFAISFEYCVKICVKTRYITAVANVATDALVDNKRTGRQLAFGCVRGMCVQRQGVKCACGARFHLDIVGKTRFETHT